MEELEDTELGIKFIGAEKGVTVLRRRALWRYGQFFTRLGPAMYTSDR